MRFSAKTLPVWYRYTFWLLLDSDYWLQNGILKLFFMYYSKIKRNGDNCRYFPYDDLRNCDINWFKQIGLASWVNINEWFVWKENETSWHWRNTTSHTVIYNWFFYIILMWTTPKLKGHFQCHLSEWESERAID